MYLEIAPGLGVYNRRGKIGKTDDPEGFERMMKKRGLRCFVSNKDLGKRYIQPAPGMEDDKA